MKNLLKKSLFTLAIICIGYGAFAQQTQDVTVGSNHTYTAKLDASTTAKEYKWKLLNEAGVDVLASEKSITASVDWLAAGFTVGNTYRIESQVLDINNCYSEIIYVDVTIAGAASVMFADAGDNINILTCSLITGETPNDSSFDVVFSGGVAPYELTYDVTDKDGNTTSGLTKSFATTTGTLTAADFEYVDGAVNVVTITLVSAKTKDLQDVTVDTGDAGTIAAKNNIRTLTVRPKPVITEITLN